MIVDACYYDYDPTGFDTHCREMWTWRLPLNKKTQAIEDWCHQNFTSPWEADFMIFNEGDEDQEIGISTKNKKDADLFSFHLFMKHWG